MSKIAYLVDDGGVTKKIKRKYKIMEDGLTHKIKKKYVMAYPYDEPMLPEGYTRLTYVQSGGAAWFNTDFKPNQNTRVELDFRATSTATHIFGARTSYQNKAFCVCWLSGMPFVVQVANRTYSAGDFDVTARYLMEMTGSSFKLNGETRATYSVGNFQCEYNMWLFSCPNGSDTENSSGYIYGCKVYDGNTLVRHYVPARNASGVVGFYDFVNNTFGGSMTGTPFTGGEEVKPVTRLVYLGTQSIAEAVVTLGATLTYNGSQQTKQVQSVVLNGERLTEGLDYTVSGNTATEGGSYTMTITGINDYEGVKSVDWKIEEAEAVFGVMWDYTTTGYALTRLNADNDPNGYADTTVSVEPVAAIGTGGGSSPFDGYFPWKGMKRYNAYTNGEISPWATFSDDTVVYIPEYWCKVIDDTENSKLYVYIANKPTDGFVRHPGSNRYVGRYTTGEGYVSKTGLSPITTVTRADARAGFHAKSANWYQYDYATYSAIQLLYTVEWADLDCQAKIGKGYGGTAELAPCGGTDTMAYHTGRADGTDGATQVQYRWIENMWGNAQQYVDGISVNNITKEAYICTNPEHYSHVPNENYVYSGVAFPVNSSTMRIGKVSPGNLGWCLIPYAQATYSEPSIPDFVCAGGSYEYTEDRWNIVSVSHFLVYLSYAGIYAIDALYDDNLTSAFASARLIIVP